MGKQPLSHLTDIEFKRVMPSPALQPFIQWFWAIQSCGHISEKYCEFMHANGSLSLLFNWGDTLRLSNDCCYPSVSLESVNPQSRRIILTGNVNAFGLLFRPGGAFPFCGIPMHEVASVDQLQAVNLLQLYEQLSEIPGLQDKIKHVESRLTRLLAVDHTPSEIIPVSLNLIESSDGKRSIQQVADRVHVSERQLERLFNKEVGLSPKKYAGLIRLQQAREALKQSDTATLTDVAHFAGFYDQAHFNREFKKTIGITPGAYIALQRKNTMNIQR